MGRPIGQWDATAGWAGPFTNGANDRPIEQWAQPIPRGVPPWPSGLYSGLVLSLWRKALVRVPVAPPSYVFPLLELSDLL